MRAGLINGFYCDGSKSRGPSFSVKNVLSVALPRFRARERSEQVALGRAFLPCGLGRRDLEPSRHEPIYETSSTIFQGGDTI